MISRFRDKVTEIVGETLQSQYSAVSYVGTIILNYRRETRSVGWDILCVK